MSADAQLSRRSPNVAETEPQNWRSGLAMGTLGLLAFSGTLPATRVAVSSFGPTILTCCRIEIAAALGVMTLVISRIPRWPPPRQLPGILWTGFGLAVGYPYFVALALERAPAAHGSVVIGLTPAATAIIAVLRTGERPPLRFWIACLVGITAIGLFAFAQGGGRIELGDAWLLAAMLSVGIAYVEGGRVSREFGGAATLCWAMIMLAPFAALPLMVAVRTSVWRPIPWSAWAGFWYVGVISMFLGSVAWYRGLAAGGVARIGQLNLAQPLLALLWSSILLGEHVSWPYFITAAVVVVAMSICIRTRVATEPG